MFDKPIDTSNTDLVERCEYGIGFNAALESSALVSFLLKDRVGNFSLFQVQSVQSKQNNDNNPCFGFEIYNITASWIYQNDGSLKFDKPLSIQGQQQTALTKLSNPFLTVYPNPYVATTSVVMNIEQSGHITISLFDLRGELVTTILDKQMIAGRYSMLLPSTNMPSGTYLLHLANNGRMLHTQKMIFVK